jgi:hypothetical protein
MPAWLADWRLLPAEAAHADATAGEAAVGQNGKGLAGAVTAKRAGPSTDAGDDPRTGIAVDDRADGQRFALSAAAERLALAATAGDSAPKAVDNAVAMESSPVSAPALPSLPSLTLLAMPAAHAAPGTVPVAVGVPTPFGSPDFAAAFGLQVSLLARDGHHRAELHLNPAEMGPVSVQIVVDGTQARIDFGADVAATRQAIEAGLPELASALRDAGLTLHGGGVSSHAGNGGSERGERDTGTDRAREPSLDGAPEAHTPRVWRHATGGVDLYV